MFLKKISCRKKISVTIDISWHDKANDKKDLIINLSRSDDARERNPIHFPRAFFINAIAKRIRTRESSWESGAKRRWPFNGRMLTPAANGMPIMFYAFFIFERRGRKGPRGRKDGRGQESAEVFSNFDSLAQTWSRQSSSFSLGVDRKIKF